MNDVSDNSAGTLRKLFLTLFLRGQSARGLKKDAAPKSVGRKLAFTLLFYGLFGCMAFLLVRQPVFFLSAYLHAMTFAFVGMFVAASAGEILFNQSEADILLHRPIEPRVLLWAKVRVLVEVSLWIGGAFNLAGLYVGFVAPNGSWLFPLVHAASTVLQAMFCAACVVVVYQLCLRWFGREKLEAIMVTAQVIVSVAAVLAGQILPRMIAEEGNLTYLSESAWWIGLVPPAWFAGIDDALAGSGAATSWLLSAMAVASTVGVLWLAFGKLAESYEAGLQVLGEARARPRKQGGRLLDRLVDRPPLCWWLRDPVVRASFLLTVAYLVRDRDVKLRVYPGLAPFLVLPVVFMFGGRHGPGDTSGFPIALSCGYLSLVPMLGANMLSYSQHWQAADLFRVAPLAGPGRLCHGARRAVLCCLALPLVLMLGVLTWLMAGTISQLFLLLPGLIALPVFALIPSLGGQSLPLSRPGDESKAANRGLTMVVMMFVAMGIGGLGIAAQYAGVFWWFVLGETLVAGGLFWAMCRSIGRVGWTSAE